MKNTSEQCIRIGEVEGEGLLELSTSKVKKWRKCQMSYKYKYVDKLRPKKKAVPLRRGTWVHSCLEARDLGKNWVETIKELKATEYDKLFAEEKLELGDLPAEVFRMMRAYHYTYEQVDKAYETVRCEQDFMIRIPGTNIVVTGKIDKIALHRESRKLWVFEHKTMKNTPPTEDFRMTDTQTALYTWVLYQIRPYLTGYEDCDLGGVMFDYIKTKPPTIPEVLKNGTMSKRKIDCDRWTYIACLKREHLDPADYEDFLVKLDENVFFRRIPMNKSPVMVNTILQELVHTGSQINTLVEAGCISRNLDWTCDRPKCEYRDLCYAELQGADTNTLIQMMFERSDSDNGQSNEPEDEPDVG